MIAEKTLADHLAERFVDDREKMERYSAIAKLCPLPIFIVAHDGETPVYTNPAYEKFTDRTLADLVKFGWLDMIHPDDRAKSKAAWDELVKTNVAKPMRRRYVRKDGTVVEGVMTAHRVEMNGFVGFIVPECEQLCQLAELVSPAGIPPAT